jgi:hypothetical protein
MFAIADLPARAASRLSPVPDLRICEPDLAVPCRVYLLLHLLLGMTMTTGVRRCDRHHLNAQSLSH